MDQWVLNKIHISKVDINKTDNLEKNISNPFHFQMLSTKMFMSKSILRTKMRLESTAYLMLKVKMKSQSQVLLKMKKQLFGEKVCHSMI